MKRRMNLAFGTILAALVIILPTAAFAAKAHTFACTNCHRAAVGSNPRALANFCVNCHLDGGPANPMAKFTTNDASNAFAKNSSATDQTSHTWGGTTTAVPSAGSTTPSTTFYTSRYGISNGRVTCSICHDPHVDMTTKVNLLRASGDNDLICQQCHGSWYVSNSPDVNATLTHPIVANYETFAAANPTKYKTLTNADQGVVRLVNGAVSCTSCHSSHYADSRSDTPHGRINQGLLLAGDGHLLRADGPLRTGTTRDGTDGTAQRRSNLCQACHTYKLHGKGGNQQLIGCLDCHGGHSYNGGSASAYVLKNASPDAVPVRANRLPNGTANVTFATYAASGSTRTKWADNIGGGSANGYCEKCHGDINSGTLGGIDVEHLPAGTNECSNCHKHIDTLYSFANDANAATCGQCHGFPPYKDISGYRAAIGDANDGGWADNKVDIAPSRIGYDLTSPSYFKNETQAAHKTHAGAHLSIKDDAIASGGGAGEFYFVGTQGIDNCKPCHGANAGNPAGGHRQSPLASYPNTFRDVSFASVATTGGVIPSYDSSAATCSSVYCHSNGRPRSGDGPTRSIATRVSPAWAGLGTNYAAGGFKSIFGQTQATRCSECHGYSAASMTTRSNSAVHNAHLGGGTMAISYECDVCHAETADRATTSKLKLYANDGSRHLNFNDGHHVNGTIEVKYKSSGSALYTSLNTNINGTSWAETTGTCSVYCHDPADTGITADWDNTTDMQCDTCHGGLSTDTSANGGVGVITSGSHTRHITTANGGPGLSCDVCHGTNSTLGTHVGHIDGIDTMLPPVNGVAFADICQECHGYDNQAGEVLPVWGSPSTSDCATCHAGNMTTDGWGTAIDPPIFPARTTGHGRLVASGNYPVTGNAPANTSCLDCHVSTASGHFTGGTGDTMMLRTDIGFPATYSGNENAFCGNCHGTSPAHPTKTASATTRNISTHAAKKCVACHDLHGTTNIQMVWSSDTEQNAKDTTAGKYSGGVVFVGLTGEDSFDEDDGTVGAAGEANSDDLCATCHTSAAGTSHNNNNNTDSQAPGGHNIGTNCLATCHSPHTDTTNSFKAGAGSACNSCHDYPPNTGAHGDGSNKHTRVSTPNKDTEDRSDCAFCHTGADLYTYDTGADQVAGGARGNHAKGDANQKAVLTAAVGYNTTNLNCTTACHLSSAADGAWNDANGLNCNACHYYEVTVTGSGNNTAATPKDLKGSHNAHFAKNKQCSACHTVPTNTTHISIPTGTDIQKIQSRATALQDEATVLVATYGSGSDPDPGNTTCAGAGVGLGCHNTKLTPAWTTTGISCTACHVPGGAAAADPTSGLHDVVPSVSGIQHDDNFLYNSGGSTANCTTCHTASPSTGHEDGVFDATKGATGNTKITFAANVGYADAVVPTCAPSLAGCHVEVAVKAVDWRRKWHENASSTTGACAGCHGDWINGWNTNVQHHTNAKAQSTHGTKGGNTYECEDCHGLEASAGGYNFTFASNDWDPAAAETTLHGNGIINVNSNGTGFLRSGGQSGCPTCHTNWATDGKHAYTQTEWPLTTIAADSVSVTCSTCHGGLTSGTNASNYWPDKAGNDATEDNAGRHLIHMTRLAKAKYNEDITALLTNNGNGTADAKQKYLCAYCHTAPGGDFDHGDVATIPAEVFVSNAVRSSKTMWDTVDSDAAYASGNCSNVECHNGKATSATTNFTWYGTGIQSCVVCHNDITVTTAGTTGASHQAHIGAGAAVYGKVINCASCHGGSVTWSPYAAPTSNHINGTFNVGTAGGSGVPFTYSGTYTNAATRTVGNCDTNLCHNNGKNAATPAYTWQTAISGCAACHATSSTLGSSHDPHLTASFTTTFRSTSLGCTDCHDAVSAADMTGKTAHMDGTVNLAAGITYTGTPSSLSVTVAATYGQCSASVCHENGLGTDVNSPLWNRAASAVDNCTICHGAPPTTGRHTKHLAETDYITGCGNCHTGATATAIATATHFNGTRDTAGTSTVVYTTANGTCTNTCHKVTDGRDWTSGGTSPVLACTDCHQAGTIADSKGALPSSGLHNMTANGVQKHDSTLGANGCKECHVTPAGTHLNGLFVVDSSSNNDRFLTRTGLTWADGASNSGTCFDNGTTGLDYNAGAGCHRDNGVWKRLWSTNANIDSTTNPDPGQLVCDVCHGQYQSLHASSKGWREGSVHYRSGSAANENKGSSHNKTGGAANACEDCHAYDTSGGSNHQNGTINFSGGNGVPGTYTLTTGTSGWYCASCHNGNSAEDATATDTHTFPDSTAFASRAYVVGTTQPEGGCTGCHGNNGTGGFWPDSSTGHAANTAGAHPDHVREIAKKLYATSTPSVGQQNSTCDYCHPAGSHNADTVLPADISNTDSDNNGTPDAYTGNKFKKIIGGASDNNGFWRSTPGTCSTVACHASAPFTPHWYADTVVPAAISDLANIAGTDVGSVKLTWTAPGDDGSLDGTAYRYDVRYSTAAINAGNFDSASQGPAPTVKRKGKAQTIDVKGLVAGTTYYFAVKTYDEAGNVSAISNLPTGVAAKTDTVAPVFYGINAVSSNDYSLDLTPNPDTNSVNVFWDAARDHSHSLTTPINYLVLWSEYSLRTHFSNGGPVPSPIGTDACFDKSKTGAQLVQAACGSITPSTNEYRIKSAQTTALNYDVPSLPVGTVYNFLVRAKDASGNIDTNRAELMAMAKTTNYQTIALQTQYTSAVIPSVTTGWTGLPGSFTSASDANLGGAYYGTQSTFSLAQNAPVVFSPTTTYSVKTNVWGLSFQIKITGNTTAAAPITYQFGYLTGKAFTAFGTSKSLSISRRAPIRMIKFPLSSFKGMIPAGSKPAFVCYNTSGTAVTLTYGSTGDKGGILLFNQQDFNDLPTGLGSLAQADVSSSFIGGNLKRLTWSAASAVNGGQTVHYDVFGSIDGGVTYPYTIGRNLTTNTVDWDPVGDGITGNQTNVVFKVLAGDGYREGAMLTDGTNANNENHSVATSAAFTVNNTTDIWSPAAIGSATGTADDLTAETRPKQGAVNLTWKAVGNDGFNHGTRATQYDIRYSTSTIDDGNWGTATQANNEPKPDFTGAVESYELLGLNPDATYYFAMKVGDATGNWSPISNVASVNAGPKCGICHSTPPDESATAGNHIEHGYTMNDCANCHGTEAATFTTAHQDGALKLGWKTATPAVASTLSGTTITYTQGGNVIYSDTNGAGGFVPTPTLGDGTDSGTCSGFTATNTSGCHGPASPSWIEGASLACSACHGLSSRTTDTYSRNFDATIDNGMVVPDEIKAAPPVDNRGGNTGKYVGAHLKHLNSSFRLAKGDNCTLCHKDSVHADGTVDVAYDLTVTGTGALWTAGSGATPGTCGGTSTDNCHGSNTPSWDSAATVACNQCHGFGGVNPAHVTDGSARACTWCHPAGHPQGTVQDTTSIMIPNNPLVGIAYRSGGIHLLKTINGRTASTEAQICWACHDAQGTKVTEWAANNDAVTGSTPYNYGDIFTDINFTTATSNWLGAGTGAYWRSGTTAFQTIKKGKIQSTHSTNSGGTSTVAWDATNKRYNESLDAVADIRCSNCHDVHNMNKALGDTATGTPYLRGTWKGNPYNEDGPPLSSTTYVNVAVGSYGFGAVPRAGTGYRRLGGYFIDQNNVTPGTASATATATLVDYPTTGWTQESSAGLCILCHGSDVDNMDQKTGEALWLGTNGHSNSAIGGTFTNSANIFDNAAGTASLSGRPTPVGTTSFTASTQVPDMAYQMQPNTTTTTRGYGYRGTTGTGNSGGYSPTTGTLYAHYAYDWGATVDAGTTDQMYHQFSCSKCHNPHASRLPKLLITNCLDVQHNTWTAGTALQATYTATTLRDVDKNTGGTAGYTAAYYASAQNCHRYNDKRTATNKGGWNKVSMWTTANQ